ncbi:MAG: tRNA guanosine(34) transglycosylase Tgt [Cytophagales bacterium]|nr:tRNA guanosine(34) transglycosylase Tgt [Cytophagales bacterium]MDW8384176.1 tRNA guanosine(34) transglycosylase Tgt [Flammeovirgaceae bacterium]
MFFYLQHTDNQSKARAGEIHTEHGIIQTPIFMPVGTAGTVKAVHQRELIEEIGAQIILSNTYHLYLRPGTFVIEKAGGLHCFNGWNRPILTDSGGYQVFSLAENRKITEEGVIFKSHIDGSKHIFTPENIIDIQRSIGADIIMAFDECPPYPSEYGYAKKSMELTHRWLTRCIHQFDNTTSRYSHRQVLFPIVQGSTYKDLRKCAAEWIASLNREGNAIGGLSVGEPPEKMYEITALVCEILPENKPRYLMGVGTPANILECIALGVDMFDCVMPTRNARNGMLFTTQGIINIRNAKWATDFSPIDESLGGYVSTHYTKAYLRHLIHSKEILGAQIASIQNLTFYLWLVRQARQHILQGDFMAWKNAILPQIMQRL